MADLTVVFNNMIENTINALPSILAAIIVIVIGYFIGIIVGKGINKIVTRLGFEKAFDGTVAGRAFRTSGLDLSDFMGGVAKAYILILAIIFAIGILDVGGIIGVYLTTIADYLPRLLGGVLVIVFGSVFVEVLASFIGQMIKPMFPAAKSEIADMLKNLLQIGLIAFVLLLAFELMLLQGNMIYPLILGFVIIGAGISLTDGLIKSITDDHKEFNSVAGYAKFVLYSIFLIIGAGAIFATFPNVTTIISNVSWAFAIAFAIMLIPIVYALARKMSKEEA